MKYHKIIIKGSCTLLLIFSSFSPLSTVLSEEQSAPPIEILQQEISKLRLEEGNQYTLQELLDRTSLSNYEKETISKEIITQVQKEINEEQSRSMFRALVTNVYRHLSPSEVKECARQFRTIGSLVKLIPRYGSLIEKLYIVNAESYEYAAARGWGIDLLITLDPYNPTSTGMTFSFRYSH